MTDERVPRRRFLRTIGATGTAAIGTGVAAGTATGTDGDVPQLEQRDLEATNAPDVFAGDDAPACDVDRTSDVHLPFDTDGAYGGWGGHEFHDTDEGVEEPPVVFVHGNTDDACAFEPHAATYLDQGWSGDRLWSITFREETTAHEEMADQLDDFVANVLEETGAEAVNVVAHSLGVTGARFWMAEADRYDAVETFVGLAGANHGTWVCGPGCEPLPGPGEPCQFVSTDCAEPEGPLWELNTPEETPGDVEYYTIRGGFDVFFLHDRESPALDGAENVQLEWAGHDAVRESDATIRLVYEWLGD